MLRDAFTYIGLEVLGEGFGEALLTRRASPIIPRFGDKDQLCDRFDTVIGIRDFPRDEASCIM